MIIEAILYIVILASSMPVGYFLAVLCKDELVKDRKYMLSLAFFLCFILIIISIIYSNLSIMLALFYFILVLFFMIRLGRNEEFMKKKRLS